jgi:branched-chain amino acid transport system ATP-binding protein
VFLSGTGGGSVHRARRRPVADRATETALTVDDVHVSFGGVSALDGAGVRVRAGEVVGIIGPNGAGKTTLFDVISGYVRPDSGTVRIDAVEVGGLGPDARARLGLARSFQNARLFPSITVREVIAVALERHLANRSTLAEAAWLPRARRSERRAARRVEWLIDLLNLEDYADKFVGELSTGSRRMVDLACIMATEPRILLLDEPSSGLAQAEIEALGPVVRRLVADTGCGVLLIEHDIPLVTGVADRLVAMEAGRAIADGSPDEVVTHPRVIAAYLGASRSVISRSGALFHDVLAAAGIPTTDLTQEAD